MQPAIHTGNNPLPTLQQPVAPAPLQQSIVTPAPAPTPVVAPQVVQAPVVEPQVAAPALGTTDVGQCSMNAYVKLETRAVIELPWGIFDERFNYAFIGSLGELVVATDAPRFDKSTDNWDVTGETIVFGKVPDSTHWRDSLTLRPDDEVEEEEELEVEEETVVVQPKPVPEYNVIDTSNMSRNQFKRHKAKMQARGLKPNGEPLV